MRFGGFVLTIISRRLKEMVEGFYEKLLNGILIVSVLLMVCVCVDYADTITAEDTDLELNDSIVVVNESYVDGNGFATSDKKIYTEKQKKRLKKKSKKKSLPTVTITARPSVRSGYSYKWYTTTWVDYCPHCHRYDVLYNAHKPQARFEQELTCKRCGADYCGVVGKEKYSWSHYYLTKAK